MLWHKGKIKHKFFFLIQYTRPVRALLIVSIGDTVVKRFFSINQQLHNETHNTDFPLFPDHLFPVQFPFFVWKEMIWCYMKICFSWESERTERPSRMLAKRANVECVFGFGESFFLCADEDMWWNVCVTRTVDLATIRVNRRFAQSKGFFGGGGELCDTPWLFF
jgi:hypothetical protein